VAGAGIQRVMQLGDVQLVAEEFVSRCGVVAFWALDKSGGLFFAVGDIDAMPSSETSGDLSPQQENVLRLGGITTAVSDDIVIHMTSPDGYLVFCCAMREPPQMNQALQAELLTCARQIATILWSGVRVGSGPVGPRR